MERMRLVIDRSKWLRGEGAKASYLLRESDSKMCCLGFLERQLGADVIDMMGQKFFLRPWYTSDWIEKTYKLNDWRQFDDREQELIKHFAACPVQPIDLEFTDGDAEAEAG